MEDAIHGTHPFPASTIGMYSSFSIRIDVFGDETAAHQQAATGFPRDSVLSSQLYGPRPIARLSRV